MRIFMSVMVGMAFLMLAGAMAAGDYRSALVMAACMVIFSIPLVGRRG